MKKIRSSTACAWFLCGALEITATFGLSSPALADEASDAREGEALATKICSDCHVVSPKVGPPFAEIAKGSRAAPEALRDFLHSTHSDVGHPGAMPNPALTERQIDEIAAYLATMRGEVMWQPTLHRIGAKPNGKGLRRKDVLGPLSPIRTLRSRIAHHEPIITWDSPEAPRQNG